ncbi:MAG: hypothetical protein IJR99_08770 [Kiritimatiellae bacterium]|nr:hypothetical protein [Kiritimatiellia bacterium]
MKRIIQLTVSLLLPVAAGAASVVPYGTYLVKGSFRGDYNTVLADIGTTTVTVRAQRADGTAVAESPVRAANAEGVNFILSIPVASESIAKACSVGETLDCTLFTDEWSLTVTNVLTVGAPIHVGNLTINYTDVESYTNSVDGTVVEIPAEYIAEAQAYLDEEMGGGTYDPWGDYDGDGVSNYGEYLAGTHPFDASDVLRITSFRRMGEQFSLQFEHVGGHVYAVSAANTLARPQWAARRVRKSAKGAELDQVLADGDDGEPGVTEIFITPAAGATSEFFRLEAK